MSATTEVATPDLDSIALDIRMVASLLSAGYDATTLDLPAILTDLATAVDAWHEDIEARCP